MFMGNYPNKIGVNGIDKILMYISPTKNIEKYINGQKNDMQCLLIDV